MAPRSILILTGSGISAESGIDTFRTADGIWSKVDYRDVATPEGFARDPDRVHAFYNMRRRRVREVQPNAAHFALARLEREYPGEVLVVTQNVDSLHERAGSQKLIHMHGQHDQVLCDACGARSAWTDDLTRKTPCPACGRIDVLRPDVVWFGETPYHMERIQAALAISDLFVSIGTSGNVYPAAGFVRLARGNGAQTLELNLEPSEGISFFHEARHGKATEIVPDWVEQMLSAASPE